MNTDISRIQSEYGKKPTRKTPNTDTFYAAFSFNFEHVLACFGLVGIVNFTTNFMVALAVMGEEKFF